MHGNYAFAGGRKPYKGFPTQGVGAQQFLQPTGFLAVNGKTGESVVVPSFGFLSSVVDQGVQFQAVGGDIDVEYTLEPAGYNHNTKPENLSWCNKTTVSPGTIVTSEVFCFSAIKVTFTSDSILYMATR